MASVQLTTEQLIDLVLQLPPEGKREVLQALATDAKSGRADRTAYAEEQLRRLSRERGLNWDAMTEDEREALADDLIPEDRSCRN